MKRLIILLLIVVGFAHEEMGELEKELLYKQNDRSPLIAGLCAFTPTVGHIYVGKWELKRFMPVLWGLPVTFAMWWYAETYMEYKDGGQEVGEFASMFPFVGAYYFQFQDAIYLAYQHNADLYEEIYGKEYIRPPKKSLIQKWIDKKEAKKKDE